MINETISNISANATQILGFETTNDVVSTVLIPEIFSRYFVFIIAPFIYPEMWWLLFHLLLTFVLFEFYFDRHDDEDLGWSAALANSIVAIFASMELLRAIYHHEGTPLSVLVLMVKDYWQFSFFAEKTIILSLVILLALLGIFTAIINYFHLLPRQIAFIISGHKVVNLLAYFLIVVVWRYTHNNSLPLDIITVISFLMFALSVWFLIFIINYRMSRNNSGKFKFKLFD